MFAFPMTSILKPKTQPNHEDMSAESRSYKKTYLFAGSPILLRAQLPET